MPLILKCNNGIVTDTYLEIIGEALSYEFGNVRYTYDINEVLKEEKNEIIVVARTVDAFKLLIKGYSNVIMWFQGVEPEESFMAHNSMLRFHVLSFMEKYILKKSLYSFFVSAEMHDHYEKKYNLKLNPDKYYCMPCMNTQIHLDAFESKDKYNNNVFAYIGSLAIWQRFEETARIYKLIEDAGIVNCEFRVFTAQKEEAKEIIIKNRIRNYSIDFVKNEEIPMALKDVKYGFIIREDTTVNRVATPTKISTYLSCGLIPIYSECLKDFAELASHMKFAIKYDDRIVDKIQRLSSIEIDKNEILKEFKQLFDSHYSRRYHVNQIVKKIHRFLEVRK